MNDSDAKLKKLIVVGDRVLIKPKKISNKTKAGLFLPPGYQEKEEIQTGFVVKIGPGYPIPLPSDEFNETWKKNEEKIRYIPLQAKEGDLAIFLQKGAIEIIFNDEKYFISAKTLTCQVQETSSVSDRRIRRKRR
jgi:co-chaperonin GroES (HSP10)